MVLARSWIAIALLGGLMGCHSSPAPAPLPLPPAAPVPPGEARDDAGDGEPVARGDDGDDLSPVSGDAPADNGAVLPAADPWRGKRVRYPTAVLLFAAKRSDDDPASPRMFQPLVCAINGKRKLGAYCGEVMPARAKIRTPQGELVVTRSTQPFHDEAGDHTYPAPYGPACCMYNTCVGNTVPYHAARGARQAADPHPILAVWPPDADLELEVATDGTAEVAASAVPVTAGRSVKQAFTRAQRRYASVSGRGGGRVLWDVGAGWVTADGIIGPHGYTLLATTDVDHDGHLELISYERWANDYGLDVFGDATAPIYNFSCGNI
jgi:hypothetical protein